MDENKFLRGNSIRRLCSRTVGVSQKAELSFNSLLSDVPFTALLKKIGLEK